MSITGVFPTGSIGIFDSEIEELMEENRELVQENDELQDILNELYSGARMVIPSSKEHAEHMIRFGTFFLENSKEKTTDGDN